MSREMLPIHLKEWKAKYNRSPWGQVRQDHRFAMLALTICTAVGNLAAFNLENFFQYPNDDPPEPEADQIITGSDLKARYGHPKPY